MDKIVVIMLTFVMFYLALYVFKIVSVLWKDFSLVKVSGESMLPTHKDGQILLMDTSNVPKERIVNTVEHDIEDIHNCFVIVNPVSSRYNIKRLTSIDGGMYWFMGDNRENSVDSRTYGYVDKDLIVGRIVPFSEIFKKAWREINGRKI